jgi:hypothetical protein
MCCDVVFSSHDSLLMNLVHNIGRRTGAWRTALWVLQSINCSQRFCLLFLDSTVKLYAVVAAAAVNDFCTRIDDSWIMRLC